MARAPADAQSKLFDKALESPELEAAIELVLESKLEPEYRKSLANARALVKAAPDTYDLEDGQRLRVGRYVIEAKARAGGGFEIPAWQKNVVGKISEV